MAQQRTKRGGCGRIGGGGGDGMGDGIGGQMPLTAQVW